MKKKACNVNKKVSKEIKILKVKKVLMFGIKKSMKLSKKWGLVIR